MQHSRRLDCPVELRITGSKREKALVVKLAPAVLELNHPLSTEFWSHKRENCLLSVKEEGTAGTW